MDFGDFVGEARRLDDLDIPRFAARINVGEDEVHAFSEVETPGDGFDRRGRPEMLFEPHVFYRNLSGAERDAAVEQGLAYRSWGEQPYPKDSYPRLLRAMEINPTAALKACSWGLGQILGENHLMVGYDRIEDMVRAFMADEENHLEAIIAFLVANKIDDDLRAHRWEVVARVWNGPGYAKHGYHTRLAEAYAKWSRIPDMPLDGSPRPVGEYPTIQIGERGFLTEHLQNTLADLNYPVGAIDGIFGRGVRAAVLAFQADHNLTPTGIVDSAMWAVLKTEATPRVISEERRTATMDDLRKAGSGTLKRGDTIQSVLTTLLLTAGAGGLVEKVEAVKAVAEQFSGVTETVSEIVAMADGNWWVLGVGGAVAGLWLVQRMKESRLEDHRAGKNLGR